VDDRVKVIIDHAVDTRPLIDTHLENILTVYKTNNCYSVLGSYFKDWNMSRIWEMSLHLIN
jgi:hypothetical protein